jgi:4-hydroxy-tetrahydrodipicolinate reductase
MDDETPPRVLLYGVGRFGQAAARLILDRGWTVSAALNRAGTKVGVGLDELACDPRAQGIRVEDAATADYRALAADADIAVVAVHDSLAANAGAHRELLGAGLNVACLGGESTHPAAADAAAAAELDLLARTRGVTFTGVSVWDAYRIWPLLSAVGACHRVRSVEHRSLTLVEQFGAAAVEAVGVGRDPDEFAELLASRGPSSYRIFMHLIAEALGQRVLRVVDSTGPLVSELNIRSTALDRVIPAGRVIGMRTTVEVHTDSGRFAVARIDTRLGEPSDRQHMSWTVDGDPPLELTLLREDSVLATAACIVNRIPDVLAAPPGVVTVDRLGPLRPRSAM